jgi:hypothetical protein
MDKLIKSNQIGINKFVKRQTANSKYAHFEGTWDELAELVEKECGFLPNKHGGEYRQGYRKGVMLVKIISDRFFSSVVELKDGDEFISIYKARREGEKPYIQSIYAGKKSPAKLVEIVLYSHDVLKENNEQTTDLPWEIISINAFPDETESPMPPETEARNILKLTGGTDPKLEDKSKEDLIQYINNMAKSIIYWNSHVQVTPLLPKNFFNTLMANLCRYLNMVINSNKMKTQ